MNREFLKEAIADAKAVKETAIANAKAALEESFTPHLKTMLSAKLEEMEKEDMDEEMKDKVDEAKDDDKMKEEKEYMTKKEKREGDDRDADSKTEKRTEKMRKIKEEDDSDLDEVLAELKNELDEDKRTKAEEEGYEDGIKDAKADAKKEIDSIKLEEKEKELKEAYAAVKTLKNELNEINLLNAKLLYTNKIFKSKNLTENNKVKVLTSFDKAETVKEAKLIYETLKDGLESKKSKRSVNENIGMASKSAGLGPKKVNAKPIVESNIMVDRFKKLAGII